MSVFKSLNNIKPQPVVTPDDLAADLALEMIDRIKAKRALAKAAELNCDESVPWDPKADKEAYDTLEALIGKPNQPGRHRATVLRLLLEHFPELVTQMKAN